MVTIKRKYLLIVAPGEKTRGGITAVINTYKSTFLWNKWNLKWIETYKDSSPLVKLGYFLKGFLSYLFYLPNCNLIHIHLSWPTSAKRKLAFVLFANLFKKKIIIHLHSGSEPIINNNSKWVYRCIFKNSTCTLVLADSIKNQLLKYYKFRDIKVLYNSCPIIKNEPAVDKTKTILFAGTLNKNKGYLDLLKAFSLIHSKYPDWKIILAGNGEIEKAKFESVKFGIEKQVILTGWITGREKEKLFQEASIFCLPSYTEGFPMAVLDAWSYGIPVITTPVGGIIDIIVDEVNGLTFTPGDSDELSKKIENLITNKILYNKLSDASLRLSKDQFSLENISCRLDLIYESYIN